MVGTVNLGYQTQRYDNDEPIYCLTGSEFVWNRIRRKLVEYASLTSQMSDVSHTPDAEEIGLPSYGFQTRNPIGISWGEGVGDIAASNVVTNGESFTAAAGATPPTGWTKTGDPVFTAHDDGLDMLNSGSGDATLVQNVTVVDATAYILYVQILGNTGPGTVAEVGATAVPIDGPGCVAIPFTSSGTDDDLVITLSEGSFVHIGYVRCILAADEIT